MVRAAPKRGFDGIVVLRVGDLRPHPFAAFPGGQPREADREHYLEAFRRAGLD